MKPTALKIMIAGTLLCVPITLITIGFLSPGLFKGEDASILLFVGYYTGRWLAAGIAWLHMLISVKENAQRVIWSIALLFFPALASAVYWLIASKSAWEQARYQNIMREPDIGEETLRAFE